MAFEKKEGDGVLFKNEEKEVSQHADYKGSIYINGQEYWLNAWINTAKEGGKKYMRLSAQVKKPRESTPAREPVEELNDSLEGIPF